MRSHGTDSDVERCIKRSMTIVSQLPMIQITLEDDQITVVKVEEYIRSFRGQVIECIPRAPEGVLSVFPLAVLFVLLPSATHHSKLVHHALLRVREEVAVDTRVDEPVPVLLGDVGDEPVAGARPYMS